MFFTGTLSLKVILGTVERGEWLDGSGLSTIKTCIIELCVSLGQTTWSSQDVEPLTSLTYVKESYGNIVLSDSNSHLIHINR